MPFMRGEGACPSALSRAPGFGVHRSAAQTLDRRSGRSRRRVCAGRAVRRIDRKQTICGEHDSVRESRPTAGKLLAMMGLISIGSRIRERGEHLRNRLPYMAQALREELGVSVPQLDVVACRRTGFEPDGVADYERGGFRFGFADSA